MISKDLSVMGNDARQVDPREAAEGGVDAKGPEAGIESELAALGVADPSGFFAYPVVRLAQNGEGEQMPGGKRIAPPMKDIVGRGDAKRGRARRPERRAVQIMFLGVCRVGTPEWTP